MTGMWISTPAQAVVYETEPAFCEGETLHDYLAPLKRMPKLREPPADGIGFGSDNLHIRRFPSLLVGTGSIGYRIWRERGTPAPHLDWDVTTQIERVNWRGRSMKVLAHWSRHIATVSPRHGVGVSLTVSSQPRAYRIKVAVRNRSGRRLGEFGFYFRVVAPSRHARLGLNAASYPVEHTVFGRIENFGTSTVTYGAPYTIEHLEGSTWTVAPETPRAFILPRYLTGSGLAGDQCSSFWIPGSMQPGRYRMSKTIGFGSRPTPKQQENTVTAEFDIAP